MRYEEGGIIDIVDFFNKLEIGMDVKRKAIILLSELLSCLSLLHISFCFRNCVHSESTKNMFYYLSM